MSKRKGGATTRTAGDRENSSGDEPSEDNSTEDVQAMTVVGMEVRKAKKSLKATLQRKRPPTTRKTKDPENFIIDEPSEDTFGDEVETGTVAGRSAHKTKKQAADTTKDPPKSPSER